MSQKNKKQFGVWMDTHQATVVGRAGANALTFSVLGKAGATANSNEKNEHNNGKTLEHKFYKEILTHMQNAEEVHITGTGTSQEQFMRFMSDTPQFKNTVTHESTSGKMSDEKLAEYIAARFN
jgi:stalled ribosome rescue protein Dom34